MTLKLNIIIGSTRPGRVGPTLAAWFDAFAREHGKFEPVLVDLADFALPVYDEPKHPRLQEYMHDHTKAWAASVAAGDAYVFVSPEYNYFAPPALVNAIQYLSREWAYKPAGILSYGGISGGLRAAQALKPLLTTLKVMPIPEGVPVPLFTQFIDEEDRFKPNDAISGGAKLMLDELHSWAGALASLRQG